FVFVVLRRVDSSQFQDQVKRPDTAHALKFFVVFGGKSDIELVGNFLPRHKMVLSRIDDYTVKIKNECFHALIFSPESFTFETRIAAIIKLTPLVISA